MAAVELNERGAVLRDTRVDGFDFDPAEPVRVDVSLMVPGHLVYQLLAAWASDPATAVWQLVTATGAGVPFLISVEQ